MVPVFCFDWLRDLSDLEHKGCFLELFYHLSLAKVSKIAVALCTARIKRGVACELAKLFSCAQSLQ